MCVIVVATRQGLLGMTTHSSFPVGLISNWAYLASFLIAFLPKDLPNEKRQAVKQHLDAHVGAEFRNEP